MNKITKETVFAEHEKRPRRMSFQDGEGKQDWTKLKIKEGGSTFSTHIRSAKEIFEVQTGLKLRYNPKYDNYWQRFDEEETTRIRDWMESQGTLIYLRDCLSLSIALDINYLYISKKYTPIGCLEDKGKKEEDEKSIHELADKVEQKIRDLPYYKDADLICSVPSASDKDFDLPDRVVSLVDKKIEKQNITKAFSFNGAKPPVKDIALDERWQVWEDAQVSFQKGDEFNIGDKTVILIDDKYQSGRTIQYIAMKLQQAGAREVYGLSFVKTVSDG